jgi:hypothetical protein
MKNLLSWISLGLSCLAIFLVLALGGGGTGSSSTTSSIITAAGFISSDDLTVTDDATIGGGLLTVTTANSATSTIVVGCTQSYATSTATPLKLMFTASTTAPTNGSGVIPVISYGTCP